MIKLLLLTVVINLLTEITTIIDTYNLVIYQTMVLN
jgi:hypothetical protein